MSDELTINVSAWLPELRAAFDAAAGCDLPVIVMHFTREWLDDKLGNSSTILSIGYYADVMTQELPVLRSFLLDRAESLGRAKASMIRKVKACPEPGKRLVWLSTWDLTPEISAWDDEVRLSFRGWPQWMSAAEEKVLADAMAWSEMQLATKPLIVEANP